MMGMTTDNWQKSSEFAAIWAEVKPLSEIGRWVKQNFKPFKASDKEKLVKYYRVQKELCAKWTEAPAQLKQLEKVLLGFRDQRMLLETARVRVLDTVDLYQIKCLINALVVMEGLFAELHMSEIFSVNHEVLEGLSNKLNLDQPVENSFYLCDAYHPQLAVLRNQLKHVMQAKSEYLARKLKPYKQLLGRMVGESFTVSRYEEAIITHLKKATDLRIDRENFTSITFQLNYDNTFLELLHNQDTLEQQLIDVKQQVRSQLSRDIAQHASSLIQGIELVGKIDLMLAKVRLARLWRCVSPQLRDDNTFIMIEGRHPLLETRWQQKGQHFTPRSISLQPGVTLITGANMGGKTITLRIIELFARMVHFGLMVPAKSLVMQLRSFIYFSGHGTDGVKEGLSHFGHEIYGIQQILQHDKQYGLVLIDEIAHGTNPLEGAAIAQAVIEYLQHSLCWVVVTTHYYQLAKCKGITHWKVRGLDVARFSQERTLLAGYDENVLNAYMDYRLDPVHKQLAPQYEALHIAKSLGLEGCVLERARQLIEENLDSASHQ